MKKNVGSLDRFIRLIIGLIVLWLWFVLAGTAKSCTFLGIIPSFMDAIGWCPLYPLLGINTLSKNR